MMERKASFLRAALCIVALLATTSTASLALDDNPTHKSFAPAAGALLELPPAPGMAPSPAPATAPASSVPAPAPPAPVATVPAPPAMQAAPSVPPVMNLNTSGMNTPATPPAMSAGPATAAPATPPASSAPLSPAAIKAAKASEEVSTKNPDVLFVPLHLGPDASIMYKKSDMNVINEALAVYDKFMKTQKANDNAPKDDLTSLLSSLKGSDETSPAAPTTLPNLYLGSIVYYSPGNWSVWINGRKLTNKNNQRDHEFFINRLSREEIELVWKPAALLETVETWNHLTDNGQHPLPHITVNESLGTITLILHTNQTFVSHMLDIREGLIKSSGVTAVDISNPALSAPSPASSLPSVPSFQPSMHSR